MVQVGRPRPDFFFRCWPDGNAVFTTRPNGLMDPVCAENAIDIEDGYRSFPSGACHYSQLTGSGDGKGSRASI